MGVLAAIPEIIAAAASSGTRPVFRPGTPLTQLHIGGATWLIRFYPKKSLIPRLHVLRFTPEFQRQIMARTHSSKPAR